MTKKEKIIEYGKCLQDPIYAIENYMETFDKTRQGFVQFKLFEQQKRIIRAYIKHRFNLVTKPRQAGVTTVTAAYFAYLLLFSDEKNPEKILILANRQEMAQEFLGKVKTFLDKMPDWLWVKSPNQQRYTTESKKNIVLFNGSECKAVATSKGALRGFTPTFLVIDEAAHIDDGEEIFGASMTALNTGGNCALISTPNGLDPLYYRTYDGAKKGDNSFNIVELKWYKDPRYNAGLRWIQGGRSENEEEFTDESIDNRIGDGWKPTSFWYEESCRSMNNNKRMISQELDVSFVGSGGNVIAEEHIEYHNTHNVMDPIRKESIEQNVWVWAEPVEGHKYILSSDVSRGDGADSSTFTIIDFDTMEQVVEYQGKIPPDILAQLIYQYGMKYNAYVVVDITGGIGVSTVVKLLELGYPNLHYDKPTRKILNDYQEDYYKQKQGNKTPGFNVSNNRLFLVSTLEEYVRENRVIIRSARLTAEMKTFVYRNGRPDHMKGFHDDCLKKGTLIKTIDGYKPIEDIIPGDLVLTHKGRYRPVEKTLVKPFDGEWYDFNFNGQLNLGLSYNHPLYGAPKTLSRHNEEDLKIRKWYYPHEWDKKPNGDSYNNTQYLPRQISIIEKLGDNENHILSESDFYEKNKHETNNKLTNIVLDNRFAKFLGLFLADGNATLPKKYNNQRLYSMSLAFHVKDEEMCKEMEGYLDSLGIYNNRSKVKGNGFALIFGSKFLWYVMSCCYNDVRDKILPYYAKHLGGDLNSVLEYWLLGDGWRDSRGHYDWIGCSVSKRLALSMRDIAWSVGKFASIRKIKRHRYGKVSKDQYWVHIRDDFRLGDRLKKLSDFEYGTKTVKINKSHYVGDVYNLQVTEDESFVAEGIVVHNCIMALAMALFVLQNSFTNLEKTKKQVEAILGSWSTTTTVDDLKSDDSVQDTSTKKESRRGVWALPDPNKVYKYNNPMDPTGQYAWLLKSIRK